MFPKIGKFFKYFTNSFGENYSTVDALSKISSSELDIKVISSEEDQFRHHHPKIREALKGKNMTCTDLTSYVTHSGFLYSEKIIEPDIKPDISKKTVGKSSRTFSSQETRINPIRSSSVRSRAYGQDYTRT